MELDGDSAEKGHFQSAEKIGKPKNQRKTLLTCIFILENVLLFTYQDLS